MTIMKHITVAKLKILGSVRLTRLGNQDGVVLIIVLITLMLLSLLGVTLLDSTTSELKIAGNARNNQDAFYSADAALNFIESYDQIYTSLSSGSPNWPSGNGIYLNTTTNPTLGSGTQLSGNNSNALVMPNGDIAYVQVQFIGTGNVPPGYGTQESSSLSGNNSFSANYILATATATPSNNSAASASVEAQFAKIVPQGGQ